MDHHDVEIVGREDRHSRMGIASFAISILAILGIVLFFVLVSSVASSLTGPDPQNFDPNSISPDSPLATTLFFLSLLFLGSVLITVVGLGLGIAGLVQRRRKKLFAALGTALNGLIVLGFVSLIVLGVVLGGATGA